MIKRVLLAHNFYREKGGEDSAYLNEKKLLEDHGVAVYEFEKNNEDIADDRTFSMLWHGVSMVWNRSTYGEINALIRKHKPDVAHFHNTFQLISPSAYAACHDNGVPVVQTLHNYRLICPNGLLQRGGAPCEECVGHVPFKSIRYGCYRQSRVSSTAVTAMLVANRLIGSFDENVDIYIALSSFAAKKFVRGGMRAEQIMIKPNFLGEDLLMGNGDGNYAIYVGRLSEEKGLETLIRSWERISGIDLVVLGDGPQARLVENAAKKYSNIKWHGFCAKKEVYRYMANAKLLVLPSVCYEGFPITILEAYACGTPVLVSKNGNLERLVIDGVTGFSFEPGNVEDLYRKVKELFETKGKLEAMRPLIRDHYCQNYSKNNNFKMLMDIYEAAKRKYRP